MKLTDIDLNDKNEVGAAHALLTAILGHAVSDDIPGAPSLNQTTAVIGWQQNYAGMTGDQVVGAIREEIAQDAAAVFGANPLPLPALSTAAADPLPTALAALPAISTLTPANPLPALAAAPSDAAPTAAVTATPAPGVELDSRGLPWDSRIHAGTKTKTQKGAWTAKRGLEDNSIVATIEAELRAHIAQGADPLVGGAAQPAATLTITANAAAPLPTLASTLAPLPAASAGPAAAQLATAIAGSTDSPGTFEQLMTRSTPAVIAGLMPPDGLKNVCEALGLASVVALQAAPEQVPAAWTLVKQNWPAVQ